MKHLKPLLFVVMLLLIAWATEAQTCATRFTKAKQHVAKHNTHLSATFTGSIPVQTMRKGYGNYSARAYYTKQRRTKRTRI